MDFTKFVETVANAKSPFDLAHSWTDIQHGIAALGLIITDLQTRVKKLEDAAAKPNP